MKKLFFAAAFAVVAIAGAFATNSKVLETGEFYSENSDTPDIICDEGNRLCSAVYGPTAWDKPANDPSRQPVSLNLYEHSDD